MKPISTVASAIILAAGATLAASSAPAVAAPATTPRAAVTSALSPNVTVTPSTGLSAGSVVHIAAVGLPAGIDVNLIECDVPTTDTGSGPEGCPVLLTLTTASDGTASVDQNPRNLVFRFEPFGDDRPVYCRADICRYYMEWTDSRGFHSIHTRKMVFVGSPATISVTPSTGLVGGQRVHVSGTAKGSLGRYVTIFEASCFFVTGGSGCNGVLPLATFKLTSTDTFSGSVSLFRILGDGEDCIDNMFGCQLSVVVLNDSGLPDDSFGVSRIGQPSVQLTFG